MIYVVIANGYLPKNHKSHKNPEIWHMAFSHQPKASSAQVFEDRSCGLFRHIFCVLTCIYQRKSIRLKSSHAPEVLVHRLQEFKPLELFPSMSRLHPQKGGMRIQDEEQCFVRAQIPGQVDVLDPLHRIGHDSSQGYALIGGGGVGISVGKDNCPCFQGWDDGPGQVLGMVGHEEKKLLHALGGGDLLAALGCQLLSQDPAYLAGRRLGGKHQSSLRHQLPQPAGNAFCCSALSRAVYALQCDQLALHRFLAWGGEEIKLSLHGFGEINGKWKI